MIEYISLATVFRINQRFNNRGVLDPAGVEAAVYRPASGSGDVDFFPTIWTKAAAYVHGIASTQSFNDGNKRTAWIAATMFLTRNGHRLPDIPVIEGETFVQAVAQDVFRTDEDPDATIKRAAEWLESKWLGARYGSATSPRLEFVALATQHGFHPGGTMDVENLGGYAYDAGSEPPYLLPIQLIGRIHWPPGTLYEDHTFETRFVPEADCGPIGSDTRMHLMPAVYLLEAEKGTDDPRAAFRAQMFALVVRPFFSTAGHCRIELSLDGELLASIPFEVIRLPEVPDTAPSED